MLLRDLTRTPDSFDVVLTPVHETAPDILILTNIDYDHDQAALAALQDVLRQGGTDFPYGFARLPNSGQPTGRDLDGDGKPGTARDAQGYGWFPGDGGLAVLSRFPFATEQVQDLSAVLWRDAPMSRIAADDPAADIQRLSSTAHWIVPVVMPAPKAPLLLMVFAATPPVFDGPEDRNGRRNADEVALWAHLLDGKLPVQVRAPFVLAGLANLDPQKGEGVRDVIQGLLAHPRLQDPAPKGPVGPATADWDEPRPGKLRVSYVLPSQEIKVVDSGVVWHDDGTIHKLVWVDVLLPP